MNSNSEEKLITRIDLATVIHEKTFFKEEKLERVYRIIDSSTPTQLNQSFIDKLISNSFSALELINTPNCMINNISFSILLSISDSPNCIITNNTFKFNSSVLNNYIVNLINSNHSIFKGNFFTNIEGKIGLNIINSSYVDISNNIFNETRINTNIYLEGSSNAIINENMIVNNDGPYFSYCVEVFLSNNVTVKENIITNIKFEDLHGTSLGIYFFKANGTIINNTVRNLFARLHGSYGVYVRRVPKLIIEANNVSDTFKWIYVDLTPKNGIITCSENIWDNKLRKGCSLEEDNTKNSEIFPGISMDFILPLILSMSIIIIVVVIYCINKFLK